MKNSNKYRYLAENTALFTISSFLSKFISFLLVPFYTGILTTAEYGIADLVSTTVSLVLPLLTLSIIEATIRYCLTDEGDKASIFSSSMLVVLVSVLLCLAVKPVVSVFSEVLKEYYIFFWALYAVTVIEQFLFKFCKGIEQVKICALNAIVVVLSTVVSNVVLLVFFKWGLYGYLYSLIISKLVSAFYLFIAGKLWKYFSVKKINSNITFEMLRYSIPFIPTAIAWWMNTSADRYIIIAMVGTSANGLYSVGNKIPSLLTIFTSIFQQAWQISGVKEFKDEEYPKFFSKIYCGYFAIMAIVCSIVILLAPVIAKILFQKEFYSAWVFTPYLLLGTVFSGISGVLAAMFNAAKKNLNLVISTGLGAVTNIVLNVVLVKRYGAIGAAVATAISFALVWLVRYCSAQRIRSFDGQIKQSTCVLVLLFAQAIIMSCQYKYMYFVSAFICVLIILIYRRVLNEYYSLIKSKFLKKSR